MSLWFCIMLSRFRVALLQVEQHVSYCSPLHRLQGRRLHHTLQHLCSMSMWNHIMFYRDRVVLLQVEQHVPYCSLLPPKKWCYCERRSMSLWFCNMLCEFRVVLLHVCGLGAAAAGRHHHGGYPRDCLAGEEVVNGNLFGRGSEQHKCH